MVRTAALLALIACSATLVSAEEGVVDLTSDIFDEYVGKENAALVEFYAPWCGHCKNLAPDYEKVGHTFKAGDGVIIAKVDADSEKDLGTRFGVSGFPTIKWFPKGSLEPEEFDGDRSAAGIVKFVNGKVGLNRKVKEVPSAVTVLTPENFDAIALDPSKDVLVEFYAPWCGHCKALTPKYEELATTFKGEPNVAIAKVDADAEKELGSRYGVTGFPTIKFFPRGADKEAVEYDGGREVDEMIEFINKKAGTQRVAGGGLDASVARLPAFDALAKAFIASADKAKALAEAKDAEALLTADEAVDASVYIKVMEKVVEKGDLYVASELKRLGNMISADSVNPVKKTLFQRKVNVLKAFSE